MVPVGIGAALAAVVTAFLLGVGALPAAALTYRVYVANRSSNTLSMIDTATNAVVATLPVPWATPPMWSSAPTALGPT